MTWDEMRRNCIRKQEGPSTSCVVHVLKPLSARQLAGFQHQSAITPALLASMKTFPEAGRILNAGRACTHRSFDP